MVARRRLVPTLVLVLLLAGCTDPGPAVEVQRDEGRTPLPEGAIEAVPAPVLDAKPPEAPEIQLLGTSGQMAREVHLSAHPTQPGVLLAAWQEAPGSPGWSIWAALSTDGGRSWRITDLHDPGLDARGHAFDPTTAFGPDGTAYVLYGGENVGGLLGASRITLAASTDEGLTWTYRAVASDPFVTFWDAMQLAVAPDTGRLLVVAQSVSVRGIWLWTSDDQGATWSVPMPIHLPAHADGFSFWPRIAAGPEGLVVVSTKSVLRPGVQVTVSHDGGATFGPATPGHEGTESGYNVGNPLAVHADGARIDLAFATTPLVVVRSVDAGVTFGGPLRGPHAPDGLTPIWTVASAGPDGTLHVLHTAGSPEPARWWLAWTHVDAEGAFATTELTGLASVAPPHPMAPNSAGDEYGGIVVDAAGAVYAAWSDPRFEETPRIAFARLA